MNDFVFQNTTKVYFGKDQPKHLGAELKFFHTLGLQSTLSERGIDDGNFSVMAQKACGGGTLHGSKPLTSKDVEAIFRMCL